MTKPHLEKRQPLQLQQWMVESEI